MGIAEDMQAERKAADELANKVYCDTHRDRADPEGHGQYSLFIAHKDRAEEHHLRDADWNIFMYYHGDAAMEMLQSVFPDGIANEMNFVLFSTSGIAGSYKTIEEFEEDFQAGRDPNEGNHHDHDYHQDLTFFLVRPRIIGVSYGHVRCRTPEDFEFLRKLRSTSWEAVQKIGHQETE